MSRRNLNFKLSRGIVSRPADQGLKEFNDRVRTLTEQERREEKRFLLSQGNLLTQMFA